MSAIMGWYVRDADMTEGAELCLECAGAFVRRSGSRGRRDVTLLWIHQIFTCTLQGAEHCNRFAAVLGLQIAQGISHLVLDRLVHQHLSVDAAVGISIADGGVVDLVILNSLGEVDQHRVVDKVREYRHSQQ